MLAIEDANDDSKEPGQFGAYPQDRTIPDSGQPLIDFRFSRSLFLRVGWNRLAAQHPCLSRIHAAARITPRAKHISNFDELIFR